MLVLPGELDPIVHPALLVEQQPLLLHHADALLPHRGRLVREPVAGLHVLRDHRHVVVAHVRHPDHLEVLVLQDHLVVVLDLPEVEAGGRQVGLVLVEQAQVVGVLLHAQVESSCDVPDAHRMIPEYVFCKYQ